VGRDINRHRYTPEEVLAALEKPVVQRLIELIRLRNAHFAFGGEPRMESASAHELAITWKLGEAWIRLHVNFAKLCAVIEYSTEVAGETGTIRID
jgi:sucrose phosphorylase